MDDCWRKIILNIYSFLLYSMSQQISTIEAYGEKRRTVHAKAFQSEIAYKGKDSELEST